MVSLSPLTYPSAKSWIWASQWESRLLLTWAVWERRQGIRQCTGSVHSLYTDWWPNDMGSSVSSTKQQSSLERERERDGPRDGHCELSFKELSLGMLKSVILLATKFQCLWGLSFTLKLADEGLLVWVSCRGMGSELGMRRAWQCVRGGNR